MASTKPPKRKYVTTACDACRESKVKCDGARPSCSNCENKMRECKYQIGSDKRKMSLRFVVDLLVNRVDELFQFIVDRGLSPPSMCNENDVLLKNALDTLGLREIKMAFEAIEAKERQPSDSDPSENFRPISVDDVLGRDLDIGELDPEMDLLMLPLFNTGTQPAQPQSDAASSFGAASDGSFQLLGEAPPVNLAEPLETDTGAAFRRNDGINGDNIDKEIPDLEQQTFDTSWTRASSKPSNQNDGALNAENGSDQGEEIVNRLSNRLGSLQIGSDGHVRYYGPTSHFNLLRMPTPDNLTVHRTVRKDGQDILNRLSLGKDVPRELEEHLINLYFTWQNPSFDVVDRGMYEMAKQQWQDQMEETPYYSEALKNAMCCLGAAFEPRYHPNFITYPNSVADFFADRAKALLDIELDFPCLATVQAMVVLSGHDIGCKRDARGWLYSGMAMRLAFDLGLHIDMSSHVAEGSISAAAASLRRMVFWGAYTLDHHWGFLLGRPFRISMEDVTVKMPGHDAHWGQSQKWVPYGLPYPAGSLNNLTIPNNVGTIGQYRVWLCQIMTPLGHVLYGCSKISNEELQALSEEVTSRLIYWMTSLPAPLQVNPNDLQTPYLPHVLLLHMHYHSAIIHAHRPWMSKEGIQPQPPKGPGSSHARKMCVESATAIAKLLRIYDLHYTFRRMNIQAVAITCSAALMLIFASILRRDDRDADDTVAHLNVCFRALDEFGVSWESAKRAQNFLLHMQGMYKSQIQPPRPGKRLSSQSRKEPSADVLGPKKTRLSTSPHSVLSHDGENDRVDADTEQFNWLWAVSIREQSRQPMINFQP